MNTDELSEAVAKAICCPSGCDFPIDCVAPNTPDRLTVKAKARAAILAVLYGIREPSEGMRQAFDEVEHSVHAGHPDFIWQAMLDAKKKEIEG